LVLGLVCPPVGSHAQCGRFRTHPRQWGQAARPSYGTIGEGMYAGLPWHSFVLIDKTGKQRWYGEYPSM